LAEIMPRRFLACLTICLLAATAAQAQFGGEGSGRHGGGRGGGSPNSNPSSTPAPPAARSQPDKPANQIEIVGVVRAIAPDTGRVTIAYEAVDGLNWPAGTMPFLVAKSALLKDVTVGEKVRFRLDSEQIADLRPF
jgi:Cu/Ag efflux protein CusF